MTRSARSPALVGLLTILVVFLAFALLRGVDHDESQYVAAAALVAEGVVPYRDFAYLQGPLQPFALAPVAWLVGGWAWPALRIVNALLGVVTVAASWRAMRVAGVDARTASVAAALFASADILLFSAATARNDALPAALFALALAPMLRVERGEGSRTRALLIGLLLAGAATAKISYALPAAAYGAYAIAVRRHRPGWVAIGALPAIGLVAASAAAAPAGFIFGTLTFPSVAPAEYYIATGRAWKLGGLAKLIDTVKFLALGPALLALAVVTRGARARRPGLLDWLILAGLVAALLPSPTWRQYLLPMLPPLFVRLALTWQARPPGAAMRIAAVIFAGAGLAPAVAAVIGSGGIIGAMRDSRAIRATLDAAHVDGRVTTLSPQYLPATGRRIDPRFATGPFYFRSRGLLPFADERALHLVGHASIAAHFAAAAPRAILIGEEMGANGGHPSLDALLDAWATARGWRSLPVTGTRFRLYLPPQAAARASDSAAR